MIKKITNIQNINKVILIFKKEDMKQVQMTKKYKIKLL